MLDEKLLQERLEQFNPEPLIDYENLKSKENIETHVIKEDENTVDLVKTNYLNVLNNEEIKKTSEDIIRTYGVGTCGPRAFYGTTDVHLELEQHIANFLDMEEAIVYSYGFVAISSSIAAYCKKKDIVFIDREANFPIHQGLVAAKSRIVYFDHNDPESLKNEVDKIMNNEKLKRSRKFLIIEGISWKTGKICKLPDFLTVAEQFKMRIFLEESYSLGVLGEQGKGLMQYFNIDPSRIDMIFGTLEGALGSIGGFCAGTSLLIEHQRLSGSGYIFSASLPTYLVKAAIKSIDLLEDKPKKLVKLAREFYKFLKETGFVVESDSEAPFQLFTVPNSENMMKEREVQKICKDNGVYIMLNDNGLLVNLNVALLDNKQKLQLVYNTLKKAIDSV